MPSQQSTLFRWGIFTETYAAPEINFQLLCDLILPHADFSYSIQLRLRRICVCY